MIHLVTLALEVLLSLVFLAVDLDIYSITNVWKLVLQEHLKPFLMVIIYVPLALHLVRIVIITLQLAHLVIQLILIIISLLILLLVMQLTVVLKELTATSFPTNANLVIHLA